MSDLTVTMDVKTLIAVAAVLVGGAVAWGMLKADTSELRRVTASYEYQLKETHTELEAVKRQLVELTVTLKLKGVTP